MNKVTRGFKKVTGKVAKNSPLLLTVAGVLGLGATAYLSYKAAGKVEKVLDDMEESQETDTPMMKRDLILGIGKAVVLPATVGTASICSIAMSYFIMNNRVMNLTASLTTALGEQVYYRAKYLSENGDEKTKEFFTPAHDETVTVTDENGNEKEEAHTISDDIDSLWGAWFTQSDEYLADDHNYNLAYIESKEELIQNKLFRNGYVVLNDVRDALGLSRTRAAATVGFTTEDLFTLDTKTVMDYNHETGVDEPKIWVSWPKPRNVVDQIDYNGRYGK